MYMALSKKLKRIETDLRNPNPQAMDVLRIHRDNLKKNLPHVRQSIKKQQLIRRIRFYDYVLVRMVFFKEDHITAWHEAEIKRILGVL